MRVVLDWQHTGKPSAPSDIGAVHLGITEVDVVGRYLHACRSRLHTLGHEVFVVADGEYRDRASRCNALRPALYVAGHANAAASPTDYGAVFHWPGSARGTAAATAIAEQLRLMCPWQDVRVIAAASGTWDRVRACIGTIQAPAILLEPAFLTGANGHAWLRDHAEDIGRAIAEGIHRWGGT
jgi:N-acetylmuramoyl-L-alanine amidase